MAGCCIDLEVEVESIVEQWYAVHGRAKIPEVNAGAVRDVLREMEYFEYLLRRRYRWNPLQGFLVRRHPGVKRALELCRHKDLLRRYLRGMELKSRVGGDDDDSAAAAVTLWMKEMEDIDDLLPA